MKRKLTAMLLISAMALSLLSGCGDSAGKNTTPPQTSGGPATSVSPDLPAVLHVKTSGQNVVQTAVPLIAGEMLGTWEKYGLDVTRTHYVSGPPQLEANPAGDWDIGWIGATAAINGILNYDMKLIGLSGFDYSNVAFAREDSDIVKAGDKGVPGTMGTAAEWRGKTIICGIGTVNYCDLMLTLEALGITDEDVDIVNMDISTGLQAFLTGEGDIYFASSTYATQAASTPGLVQIHSMEGMDAGMAGTLIASGDYLEKNEETTVTYLAAALDVLLYLHDEANNEQSAKWFVQVMKEDFGVEMTEEAALANMKQIGFRDLSFYEDLCKTGDDGLTGLQAEFKKFFEYHVTIGSYEADQLDAILAAVDCSYLQKAIEKYKADNAIA